MGRTIEKINQDWEFCFADHREEKEVVCLPHSVKLTPANSSGGRNYQGICLYNKEIFISESCNDKKIFVEFEGAMGISRLFVNGKLAKEHFCGYTPLVADITDFIVFNRKNSFLLELDNRDNDDVPPGKAQRELDFSYDGGIYREAKLITTSKIYITNAILANKVAGGGVFVSFDSITDNDTLIRIKTNVKNETEDADIKIIHDLYDADGNVVVSYSKDEFMKKNSDEHFEYVLDMDNPHLWSIEDPYLYNLKTSIYCKNELIDSLTTEIGIRSFAFTLKDGFVLNGKPMRLSGANYHQTYPYIGNGVPYNLLKRDVLKLKNAGMKNIRSHYPFCEDFVKFCNKQGLTMIVSNIGWQFCKEGIFFERVMQNMRDIIRWQRNNPCIIIWEPILNESEITYENQERLHKIVHEEYPYSSCFTASDWGPTDIAYREYDPGMLGKGREKYGLVAPRDDKKRPMWVREYGDFPDNFDDQNSIWRVPRRWGDYAMVQSVERMIGRFDKTEGSYTKVYNNKKICGYGIWPGIEHNRGYHINPCWGGYFDVFRIPKFSYYFMRSQLEPSEIGAFIFIANYWTENSPGDVTVYSNCEKVRLYHDDCLVAEQKPDEVAVKHPPFTFKNVRRNFKGRERSTLRAEGMIGDRVVAQTIAMSPGIPHKLLLEADFMDVPLRADGSDIVCVYCKVLDKEGNIVPYSADDHPIIFKLEGEGEIVGESSIGANPLKPEGGICTILVRSTNKTGEIKITSEMLWKQYEDMNIKSAELLIHSI